MALDELTAMEQSSRLVVSHPYQSSNLMHQQRTRDAVSEAAFDSSARFETALSLELREAPCHSVSTMQQRGRDILFRLGNEVQDALRQQRAHMVHEQHQCVQEGEAQLDFVRRQMESEQRSSLRILELFLQERDLVRQEAQNLRDTEHRSEQAAVLSRAEVEELTVQ